ncbi:hypothetical protein ACWEVM_11185 [Streptomyces bauhiniae]|uniref:hypothetical protein n=1 Tax=Streptomyces bauhiniae TaxID=2340725 RepID=UPI0036A5413A
MPASVVIASVASSSDSSGSCLDLMERSSVCPGCGQCAPQWSRVQIDGLRILTHDGDLICPADKTFGYLVCADCSGTGLITGTTGSETPCVCSTPGPISLVPQAVAA